MSILKLKPLIFILYSSFYFKILIYLFCFKIRFKIDIDQTYFDSSQNKNKNQNVQIVKSKQTLIEDSLIHFEFWELFHFEFCSQVLFPFNGNEDEKAEIKMQHT